MKDKNRLTFKTILKDDTFINFQGMYSKRYTTIMSYAFYVYLKMFDKKMFSVQYNYQFQIKLKL